MNKILKVSILGLAWLAAITSSACAQWTPYIGYVYPAGGQQGTTVRVQLGGQRIDGTSGAIVTGEGITAKLVHYYRKLSNQEMQLMREQLLILRKMVAKNEKAGKPNDKIQKYIERLEYRIGGYVNRPACQALSSIAVVEVTIDPGAKPGAREISLISERGVTNSMPFYIGQVPEVSRKPMKTCFAPVLGNEAFGLRKRPPEEANQEITIPCTMNGQIAPGEVNWYKFEAKKGQELVIDVKARQLVPYIADAVPGWFQPVVTIRGKMWQELAFVDDFRFNPDPVFRFVAPYDGTFNLAITDAIYRGREDFVYRVTISKLPHVTSIFPLGGRVGEIGKIELDGWNLDGAKVSPLPEDLSPGIHRITAERDGKVTNSVPFAVDTLPERVEKESNNDPSTAEELSQATIINGRIDNPGDWDVFKYTGKAGQKIVAEVIARRLDSPLDSILKITDESGKLIALNDDYDDPESGLNTHHADSYVMVELPADGIYYFHLGDTAQKGGKEYTYRLRLSPPRPDFALRAVPLNRGIRSKGGTACNIFIIRKDGFNAPVRVTLKDPFEGFKAWPITITPDKETVRLGIKSEVTATEEPVKLNLVGTAKIGERTIQREVITAEDRMQAFLWRHLVPAEELRVLVYDPTYQAPPTRIPPPREPVADEPVDPENATPNLTVPKSQVKNRLRQLRGLYEEWLLTDEFYNEKVAECEAVIAPEK